ncbi:MAG: NAD(P)/FAD-dependent oxidoreductase [Dehalococcoidia bacterium]|nr:NAD(P)/FAD-dependent oxidoreductase [Dehalococcoidia bacterium]
MKLYDTVIIGGGPAGSYLAARLAQFGYKVLVLEKKASAGQDICCTGIVGRECLDLLGIDGNLIIGQASSATFFGPSGNSLRLWRQHKVGYVIDRAALDQTLASRAQEAGVQYLFSTQATNIQMGADHLRVEADGCEQNRSFEAKTAAIATGFGSPLPEKLGLGKITDFIIGAQTEIGMSVPGEVEVYIDHTLAPGGFAWLVPARNGGGLAGLMTRQRPEEHLDKLVSNLKAQGKITSTEATPTYGVIPLRPLPRTYADRVLVVGEAAGQVKPTTGGGIYYGLLCADIAAGCLHQAFLANDFSESRLASYHKEWRARLSRELRIGHWARHLYERLGNWQIEHLHSFARNNGISQLVAETEDFSFDWHSGLILRLLRHLAVSAPVQAIGALSRRSAVIRD